MPFRRVLLALLFVISQRALGEWTIGGYLGAAHTQDSELRIQQGSATDVSFDPVAWEGRSFEGPLYYGVRGGYFFTQHVGIEGEFIHLKTSADTSRRVNATGTIDGEAVNETLPLDSFVELFSISHGNNLLLANLVLRKPLQREDDDELGRVLIVGRVGVGTSIPHPESRVFGLTREQYQGGGAAFQLTGGAEFRLWRGLYLTGEYKYTHNRQKVDIANGTARTDLNSHHGVTGLAVHF